MQLPVEVAREIEERAEEIGFAVLRDAAAAMSEAYRQGRTVRLPDKARAAAYLVTRMPATYAAVRSVLDEISHVIAASVTSVLDIGAGTGAASVAARQYFPKAEITMVERDAALVEPARRFVPGAAVQVREVPTPLLPHDLVIAAYSVGEMREPMTRRLWEAARVALVIIEPGTTAGFSRIRSIRTELLQAGAHMIAPCPTEESCPMTDPNWCHFAARVERSSLHRRVKGGELGYEDEKFSYVAVAREPVQMAQSRVVRHPQHKPGLITIELCSQKGLCSERITKRDAGRFRAARKLRWGEPWEPGTLS